MSARGLTKRSVLGNRKISQQPLSQKKFVAKKVSQTIDQDSDSMIVTSRIQKNSFPSRL